MLYPYIVKEWCTGDRRYDMSTPTHCNLRHVRSAIAYLHIDSYKLEPVSSVSISVSPQWWETISRRPWQDIVASRLTAAPPVSVGLVQK